LLLVIHGSCVRTSRFAKTDNVRCDRLEKRCLAVYPKQESALDLRGETQNGAVNTHETLTAATERVSAASGASSTPKLTSEGRYLRYRAKVFSTSVTWNRPPCKIYEQGVK
jgi:hypothetical protein